MYLFLHRCRVQTSTPKNVLEETKRTIKKSGWERREEERGGEGEEGRGGEEEMGRGQTIVNEGRHASRELGGICNDLSSCTVSLHRLPAIIQVLIYENKIKTKKNK